MSFLELLRIEFMKVKRLKDRTTDLYRTTVGGCLRGCKPEPLFHPGIYKRMACHVHSKRIGLCVLPVAVQYDCCLCDDCGPGNR